MSFVGAARQSEARRGPVTCYSSDLMLSYVYGISALLSLPVRFWRDPVTNIKDVIVEEHDMLCPIRREYGGCANFSAGLAPIETMLPNQHRTHYTTPSLSSSLTYYRIVIKVSVLVVSTPPHCRTRPQRSFVQPTLITPNLSRTL